MTKPGGLAMRKKRLQKKKKTTVRGIPMWSHAGEMQVFYFFIIIFFKKKELYSVIGIPRGGESKKHKETQKVNMVPISMTRAKKLLPELHKLS
jgi:hypothetical protein